ncbi:phosphoserine transaminase [Dongia soli]|uniref:phosphoserine transaminase n=1 Tax=Dongia soli TaxID=600628 RepID=A0ABU5EGT5_9PROT|nr:phosphoserine transaminase [Dongia soli]MDY0885571.1 phosphoserine transaminase [Dongia soli]
MTRPTLRPLVPLFSSGPCAKRPGWTLQTLTHAPLGRSHRSAVGKKRLAEVIDRSRAMLGIPADYRIGILPGSDTGAIEAALWSLLGPHPVDVLAWDSFGLDWATDITEELRFTAHVQKAPYGALPDLAAVDWSHDVVFTWNGTTSGVRLPNSDWIAADRVGLSICDATSAVFAMDLPWGKLDVVTWSWQKVLGGEAAHGMIALSPRAAARLMEHRPTWPVPKIFRLARNGKISEGIFKGETINTPSMLCVEDQIDALKWAEGLGGLPALVARSEKNFQVVADWVAKTGWIDFLAADPATRSTTSVCLKIVDSRVTALPQEAQASIASAIAKLLDKDGVAHDIGSYRDAPPGLRLWCGATVETTDLVALLPWLDWAFDSVIASQLETA